MSKRPPKPLRDSPKPKRARKPKARHGWSVGVDPSCIAYVYRNGEIYTDNELHMEWLSGWAKDAAAWIDQQHKGANRGK